MKNVVLTLFFLLSSTAYATIRVAVIDTGLDISDQRFAGHICKDGHMDFTGDGLDDIDGHGTHVASLITLAAGPGDYCLVIIKYYSTKATKEQNIARAIKAFNWAANAQNKINVINYSGGGPEWNKEEYLPILKTYKTGVTLITAAGNEKSDIRYANNFYYPASYRLSNIIPVGAKKTAEHCPIKDPELLLEDLHKKHSLCRIPISNYGDRRIVWEVGEAVLAYAPLFMCKPEIIWQEKCNIRRTGTSMATAIHTGKFIKLLFKSELASQSSRDTQSKEPVSSCILRRPGQQNRCER